MQKLIDSLLTKQKLILEKCGLIYSQIETEAESADYSAYQFIIDDRSVIYRQARVTPTKIGQFVTFWKRMGKGPIQPFDLSDQFDFFVVAVENGTQLGQFVFPKSILAEQDVVSKKGKGGKRAIRVYPPWDRAESKQALKSQKWQLNYFLEFPENNSVDAQRAKALYSS